MNYPARPDPNPVRDPGQGKMKRLSFRGVTLAEESQTPGLVTESLETGFLVEVLPIAATSRNCCVTLRLQGNNVCSLGPRACPNR